MKTNARGALPRAAALGSGVLFGVGLVVAGMTSPAKVIGFMDVTGEWDPTLALVMAGAIAACFVTSRLVLRGRTAPLFDTRFHVPSRKDLDPRLLSGAALFGVGWGLAGVCPGPALVDLGNGHVASLLFVLAMAAGAWVEQAATAGAASRHARAA